MAAKRLNIYDTRNNDPENLSQYNKHVKETQGLINVKLQM